MKRNQTFANFNSNHNKTIASSKSMRTLTIQNESKNEKNKKVKPITPSHGKSSQVHSTKGNKYSKGKKKKLNLSHHISLYWKYIANFMYKGEIKIIMKLSKSISKSVITHIKESTEQLIKESDCKIIELKQVYFFI